MKKAAIAGLLGLSLCFCVGTSYAKIKPLKYKIDEFTGEEVLKKDLSTWPTEFTFTGLLRDEESGSFKLWLTNVKGQPINQTLEVTLRGGINRFGPDSSYLGKPELLFLIDGSKYSVPIKSVNLVGSNNSQFFTQGKFLGVPTAYGQEVRQQKFNLILDMPLEELKRISGSREISCSFREHFTGSDLTHNFRFYPRDIEDTKAFIMGYEQTLNNDPKVVNNRP